MSKNYYPSYNEENGKIKGAEIFNGVIGGYGGLGVITQATLSLTDNVKVERQTTLIKASEYQEYFTKNIEGNQSQNIEFQSNLGENEFPSKTKYTLFHYWYFSFW